MATFRLMYSEREDAERILQNGFTDGYIRYEALVIAKYYRHVLGYGDARTKSKLIEFCKQGDRNFRSVPKREAIRKILRDSRRLFRDTSDRINITETEIIAIKNIRNFKYQLVILAMLALAKNNKRNVVWLTEWRNIRKVTSRYITNRVIKNAITTAYSMGIIGELKADLHGLSIIDNESKPVISINNDKDFFNLLETYKRINGGELLYCKDCQKETIRNGKRHKYCDDCWNDRRKEIKRKWWKNKSLDFYASDSLMR